MWQQLFRQRDKIRPARKTARGARLQLEQLEGRDAPSASMPYPVLTAPSQPYEAASIATASYAPTSAGANGASQTSAGSAPAVSSPTMLLTGSGTTVSGPSGGSRGPVNVDAMVNYWASGFGTGTCPQSSSTPSGAVKTYTDSWDKYQSGLIDAVYVLGLPGGEYWAISDKGSWEVIVVSGTGKMEVFGKVNQNVTVVHGGDGSGNASNFTGTSKFHSVNKFQINASFHQIFTWNTSQRTWSWFTSFKADGTGSYTYTSSLNVSMTGGPNTTGKAKGSYSSNGTYEAHAQATASGDSSGESSSSQSFKTSGTSSHSFNGQSTVTNKIYGAGSNPYAQITSTITTTDSESGNSSHESSTKSTFSGHRDGTYKSTLEGSFSNKSSNKGNFEQKASTSWTSAFGPMSSSSTSGYNYTGSSSGQGSGSVTTINGKTTPTGTATYQATSSITHYSSSGGTQLSTTLTSNSLSTIPYTPSPVGSAISDGSTVLSIGVGLVQGATAGYAVGGPFGAVVGGVAEAAFDGSVSWLTGYTSDVIAEIVYYRILGYKIFGIF